jgi:hypothetical protein
MRRGVRTPSGLSQNAGAVRRCEVRRLRLCGFPSVVRSEVVVPSILKAVSYIVCASHTTGRTAACLVGRCRSAGSAGASLAGGQPASCGLTVVRRTLRVMCIEVSGVVARDGMLAGVWRAASRGALGPGAAIHCARRIDVTC